jgi:hypothetical protein
MYQNYHHALAIEANLLAVNDKKANEPALTSEAEPTWWQMKDELY